MLGPGLGWIVYYVNKAMLRQLWWQCSVLLISGLTVVHSTNGFSESDYSVDDLDADELQSDSAVRASSDYDYETENRLYRALNQLEKFKNINIEDIHSNILDDEDYAALVKGDESFSKFNDSPFRFQSSGPSSLHQDMDYEEDDDDSEEYTELYPSSFLSHPKVQSVLPNRTHIVISDNTTAPVKNIFNNTTNTTVDNTNADKKIRSDAPAQPSVKDILGGEENSEYGLGNAEDIYVDEDAMDSKQTSEADEELSKEIQFMLWTRKNKNKPEVQIMDESGTLVFRKINLKNPVVFVVHGRFNINGFVDGFHETYLKKEYGNVIGLKWSAFTHFCQKKIRNNTDIVGEFLAKAIDDLKRQGIKYFHIVAHAEGNMAAAIAAGIAKTKIDRITGLDPVYEKKWYQKKTLSKESANLVEVIHTSGQHTGILKPLGHKDFYPNGGKWPQPGCKNDIYGVCSSRKAYEYLFEAIKQPKKYKATKCSSYDDYIHKKCKNNETIQLWSKDGKGSPGEYYLTISETNKGAKRSDLEEDDATDEPTFS